MIQQNRVLTKEEKNIVLTKDNYEQSAMLAIGHLSAYINKLAFKLSNSAGSCEDYKQELILKAWHVFRRYEKDIVENRKNARVADLINTGVRVIHNRFADLSAEFAKKTDTSLFTHKLDDIENRNPDKDFYESDLSSVTPMFTYRTDPQDELETNDIVKRLLKSLETCEMPEETISFIKETLDPSQETIDAYSYWLTLTNPKNPHKNKGIPAKVVCEKLGIDYTKIPRMKEIIGIHLVKLGMDPTQVFPNTKLPNSFWIQNGIKPPYRRNNFEDVKEAPKEEVKKPEVPSAKFIRMQRISELAKKFPNLTLSK